MCLEDINHQTFHLPTHELGQPTGYIDTLVQRDLLWYSAVLENYEPITS